MSSHALLSPSSASRWIACTPSARLEQSFPDRSGKAAEEGTLAHRINELQLQAYLGGADADIIGELQECFKDPLFSKEMGNCCDDFANWVIEKYEAAKRDCNSAELFLEEKLDLTAYVPEGFGTQDVGIIADKVLLCIDYKHGKGVKVDATRNKQLMLYALGMYEKLSLLYEIEIIEIFIYQPRIDNISSYGMHVNELLTWANTELKVKAELAFKGEGDFNPGECCTFCKANATCRALKDYNLELAKYEFRQADLLNDSEIADILSRASLFTKWIANVTKHAYAEALKGKKWEGYKLVAGRANRKYIDELQVAEKLRANGYQDSFIYIKEVKGIGVLEKDLGKPLFKELLDDLIIKPSGAPALVPITDKRAELQSADSAMTDFAELLDEEAED